MVFAEGVSIKRRLKSYALFGSIIVLTLMCYDDLRYFIKHFVQRLYENFIRHIYHIPETFYGYLKLR